MKSFYDCWNKERYPFILIVYYIDNDNKSKLNSLFLSYLQFIFILFNCLRVKMKQKIFYNRSTNSATFCKFRECLWNPPSLLGNSNNYPRFLNQPIPIKGWDFS